MLVRNLWKISDSYRDGLWLRAAVCFFLGLLFRDANSASHPKSSDPLNILYVSKDVKKKTSPADKSMIKWASSARSMFWRRKGLPGLPKFLRGWLNILIMGGEIEEIDRLSVEMMKLTSCSANWLRAFEYRRIVPSLDTCGMWTVLQLHQFW